MIEITNISKQYLKNKVLDNISFTIPQQSITGIIGPNGAGKSTLLRIIAGFEFPDYGFCQIKNKKIKNFSRLKKHISYMPESMSVYPDYFVDEFLSFFHRAVNFKDTELLNLLSLSEVFNKKIKHLSKGWHQRLKLYSALCNNRPIVLLDEPFDGFDPLQLREIISIFKTQTAKGRLFILSIHQLAYAEKICDYFIFLNNGQKIADGPVSQFATNSDNRQKSLEEIFLKLLKK